MSTMYGFGRRGMMPIAARLEMISSRSRRNMTEVVNKGNKIFTRRIFPVAGTAVGIAIYLANTSAADCAFGEDKPDGSKPDKTKEVTDIVQRFLAAHSAQINELGLSGIVGACSGYAFKRISKEAAYGIGCIFVLLQVLSHCGYIKINFQKLSDDVTKKLDQNGDGKLDADDAIIVWTNIRKVLSAGVPSVGGFTTGLAFGFYFF